MNFNRRERFALTDGVGTVPLPGTFLGANFENRITPIAPAVTIFTDETAGPDNKRGLSVTDTSAATSMSYKVVFLPFAFEAYGSPAQRIDREAHSARAVSRNVGGHVSFVPAEARRHGEQVAERDPGLLGGA